MPKTQLIHATQESIGDVDRRIAATITMMAPTIQLFQALGAV
jgi:hypothetical protein